MLLEGLKLSIIYANVLGCALGMSPNTVITAAHITVEEAFNRRRVQVKPPCTDLRMAWIFPAAPHVCGLPTATKWTTGFPWRPCLLDCVKDFGKSALEWQHFTPRLFKTYKFFNLVNILNEQVLICSFFSLRKATSQTFDGPPQERGLWRIGGPCEFEPTICLNWKQESQKNMFGSYDSRGPASQFNTKQRHTEHMLSETNC